MERKFKHSNQKFSIAITGGSSLFLSDRLCEGGASNWLVSAFVPYDTAALEKFVGGLREKACSESSSRQMAVAAEDYAKSIGINAIGVGITCSLTKGDNERVGRTHSIFVAAKYNEHCVSLEWEHAGQKYTRLEEEKIAASLIREVSETFGEYISGLSHLTNTNLETLFNWAKVGHPFHKIKVNVATQRAHEITSNISKYGIKLNAHCSESYLAFRSEREKICIYSGSFSPMHDDHRRNFRACEEIYGPENCFLELSVSNFEKPALDSIELSKRLVDMRNLTKNILITLAPTFAEKRDLIARGATGNPKIIFAVGHDTFTRVEPVDNCSFLVFPRDGKRVDVMNFSGKNIEPESYRLTEGQNLASRKLRARG
jgi:nicotinamide mononucleotide (NMN) deamidase PncC